MGRMTRLTCDVCGHAVDLPDMADVPQPWVEIWWTEPDLQLLNPEGDDDDQLRTYACCWVCVAKFAARMAAIAQVQENRKGRPQ